MRQIKFLILIYILISITVLPFGCGFTKQMNVAAPAEVIQDQLVRSAIQARLAGQASSSQIIVEASHGNVTLSGTVATPAEGNRIIVSALSVEGVRSLSPKFTVK